ncbi:unnamed protein product [Enterobius vermicularis]|uniref:GOLGA2L5 domain-containing protein n=1 Tax=Enterobius vermicularis TaxID=51028 RepID=A0A0N4VH33_ENTVE|nr:unnamed protein product [Enterobius vermicularis]
MEQKREVEQELNDCQSNLSDAYNRISELQKELEEKSVQQPEMVHVVEEHVERKEVLEEKTKTVTRGALSEDVEPSSGDGKVVRETEKEEVTETENYWEHFPEKHYPHPE